MLYQRTNCKKKANVKQPLTFHAWYTVLRANEIKMKINKNLIMKRSGMKESPQWQLQLNYKENNKWFLISVYFLSNALFALLFLQILWFFCFLFCIYLIIWWHWFFFSLFNVILLTDFLISQNITLHIHCNRPLFYLFFQWV